MSKLLVIGPSSHSCNSFLGLQIIRGAPTSGSSNLGLGIPTFINNGGTPKAAALMPGSWLQRNHGSGSTMDEETACGMLLPPVAVAGILWLLQLQVLFDSVHAG